MSDPANRLGGKLFTMFGLIAFVLGILSTGWLVLMIDQWALPWSTLAVTAPPPDEMPLPK